MSPHIYTLFLILILACQPAFSLPPLNPTAHALETKLAKRPAQEADVATINELIAKNPGDPYCRFVAGEVLASLGLLGLAEQQFKECEKLRPEYVLGMFQEYMLAKDKRMQLLYPYVEAWHEKDPSAMYQSALIMLDNRQHKEQGIEQLRKAAELSNAWPGARGHYGMILYNQNNLDLAIAFSNAELKKFPKDLVARKVRIQALLRKGTNPRELNSEIRMALSLAPDDDQMNLLLGRALAAEGKNNDALWAALRGLLFAESPSTVSEGRSQSFELLKKCGVRTFCDTTDALVKMMPAKDFKATLFRMRVGDLLAMDGQSDQAIMQWREAMRMNEFFRDSLAYKIGKELLKRKRLGEALLFFDFATRGSPGEGKYFVARRRTAFMLNNSQRDLALKIKLMIRPPH